MQKDVQISLLQMIRKLKVISGMQTISFYKLRMACVREMINAKTMSNIKIAQAKDKAYYDKKHANSKVTAIFICTILTYIYLIYRA